MKKKKSVIDLRSPRRGSSYLERAKQTLVDAHHGTRVVEFTTVVWRTEKCDQLSLREELVSIFHNLVGTADQIHIVFLQKARDDVRSKSEGYTTVIFAPASNVLIRVRPQKIAKETAVRDLARCQYGPRTNFHICTITHISRAHNAADLLHGVEIRTQATVHGEDLFVNNSSDRQAVEAIGECLPQLDIVPSLALIVETIDTVDRGALVVATEDEEVFGILDLICEEQADGLERLLATIDVVAEEEVVSFRGETTVFEETEEIVILAVNVTADLDIQYKYVILRNHLR